MLKKVLFGLAVAGAIGFFVGSVVENEMFYVMSGFVAVCMGLIMARKVKRLLRGAANARDRTSEFPNLLKIQEAFEIIGYIHWPIFADFGNFFSHRFLHSKPL